MVTFIEPPIFSVQIDNSEINSRFSCKYFQSQKIKMVSKRSTVQKCTKYMKKAVKTTNQKPNKKVYKPGRLSFTHKNNKTDISFLSSIRLARIKQSNKMVFVVTGIKLV